MKNKKAFTLAEMLMVFIIIGLISAISLITLKPWEKSYKNFYSRMYNAFSLALYNHMIGSNNSTDGPFPKKASDFCSAMLEYINTANNKTGTNGLTCPTSGYAGSVYKKAYGDLDTFFNTHDPNIIVSNGAKVWIAGDGTDGNAGPFSIEQIVDATATPVLKQEVKFYVVFVDLNGDKAPNTTLWTQNRMADIVAYLVTDKYDVIPVGYPTVDNRYLTAHVLYPTISEGEEYEGGEEELESDPMTYFEAQKKAYGDNLIFNELETYPKLRDFFKDKSAGASPFFVNNYALHYNGSLPEFDESNCRSTEGDNEIICGIKVHDYY